MKLMKDGEWKEGGKENINMNSVREFAGCCNTGASSHILITDNVVI